MNQVILSKLSKRALDVVAAGGRITHRLERQYSGREQFEYRLWNSDGERVKGFGFAAMYPLVQAGYVRRDWGAIVGSTWQNVFVAQADVVVAA